MNTDEINNLMDRLQAITWEGAHVGTYDSARHEAVAAKQRAIRQEIRDHISATLCRFQDVANAAERLHVAINLAEENYDAWNGKGGIPPSYEVQQKLSAECVAADEGLTIALKKLRP
jgi:hypothetical protein